MPLHRLLPLLALAAFAVPVAAQEKEKLYLEPINVTIPHISTDKSLKYDYDIVYVRARRAGDKVHKRFYSDFSSPVTIELGADLMLLHPDGTEDRLVEGGEGSVTDPMVSFDGQWVFYSRIYNLKNASQWSPPRQGADIFKIHVKSRKIVRLTNQKFSPNTGAAPWSKDFRTPAPGKSHIETGVYNMGPCPLPGGRIVFTSNRDGFRPANGYPAIALQLFTMDDRDTSIGDDETPVNLDKIGHFNISGALHPVVLRDGRIMFSTLESQGIRGSILWGVWTMEQDGRDWNPLVSAFDPGGAPNGFHFQTQLSDGSIVVEQYYNQNNSGFGSYVKLTKGEIQQRASQFGGYSFSEKYGSPKFGPALMNDPRNKPWRQGRHDNGRPQLYRMPFMPLDSVSLTPFALGGEGPANRAIRGDKGSTAVGKFTHPAGAPDNHLLTCYSPGPVNHQYTFLPQLDGGIYLLKNGQPIDEPAQLLLIKNDPEYNECWPRDVVPYERIYGFKEPRSLGFFRGLNSTIDKNLPEGSPFGLVGTSSFYKRESYPNGAVPKGSVTAKYAGGNDPYQGLGAFTSHGNGMPLNWHNQGADSALYTNDDIHAVRILVMEPTTDRKGAKSGRGFHNHAHERLRILGEIPLRTFENGKQPLDPDGNPDTSFLAKVPADTAFTFQTLDENGMALNMAQTWHQLRPGEVRTNCGGCHAHSQEPTRFEKTRAAGTAYKIWDLVNTTPVIVDKKRDESGKQWDKANDSGLAVLKKGPLNVEYHRDIRRILQKSCVACHSARDGATPAGKLDLDADAEQVQHEQHGKFPGTYYRLALDERAKFGHKPVGWDSWGYPNASRYIRKFQSRRSMLVWKIFGKRLDGFSNDNVPSETTPGAGTLSWKGKAVDTQKYRALADLDFVPPQCPPPGGKAPPLSDEDKRTLVRWIDLGCPIDLDFDPANPQAVGYGWMLDDNRPILTALLPTAGDNSGGRIVVGMHDYYSGLDMKTFTVTANFTINGIAAGKNLAAKFRETAQGVWEMQLQDRVPTRGKLVFSVRDRQGNIARLERTLWIK
jgi:hypothetical protein